ncbi:cysteine-rich CWC family protein [Variovorax sp. HJSM1_2]|uniref:cysteine-rich CWC family protein n=1 Tax=Variovorax sp. HJSM1_2 TaxID=3366263 RepID=UPI003BCEDE0B
MSTYLPTPPAALCPICGEQNLCAQVKAQATGEPAEPCWCFSQIISAAALAQVPASKRGLQCICQRCASAQGITPKADE